MKKIVLFIFCIISILTFSLKIPNLTNRVNDYASLLSNFAREKINKKLQNLEITDSTQIVILTIPSLKGDSIEDFSIRTAQKIGIGQKKLDNGILVVIAKKERKIRIEVGYGLEGKLTDVLSRRIGTNIMAPYFKSNNYDLGIEKGIDAIIQVIRGEFKGKKIHKEDSSKLSALVFVIFMIIALIIYKKRGGDDSFLAFLLGFFLGGGGPRGGGGFGGGDSFGGGGGGFGGGGATSDW